MTARCFHWARYAGCEQSAARRNRTEYSRPPCCEIRHWLLDGWCLTHEEGPLRPTQGQRKRQYLHNSHRRQQAEAGPLHHPYPFRQSYRSTPLSASTPQALSMDRRQGRIHRRYGCPTAVRANLPAAWRSRPSPRSEASVVGHHLRIRASPACLGWA